jgi:hypothetical protein
VDPDRPVDPQRQSPDRYLITSAPQSPGEEIANRQRRYLWTMAIRTASFVAAILLLTLVHGRYRDIAYVAAAAAIVLPMLAVIAANAGPKRPVETPLFFRRSHRALPPAPPAEPPERRLPGG